MEYGLNSGLQHPPPPWGSPSAAPPPPGYFREGPPPPPPPPGYQGYFNNDYPPPPPPRHTNHQQYGDSGCSSLLKGWYVCRRLWNFNLMGTKNLNLDHRFVLNLKILLDHQISFNFYLIFIVSLPFGQR